MEAIEKIKTFVDAGDENISNYRFVSEVLKRKHLIAKKEMANLIMAEGGDDDDEQKVYFRMNQTGNIFYSTTSQTVTDSTKDLFESVTVLFAAMTKALSQKGKDLFDYDSWGKMIRESGYFVEVSKFQKELTIKNNTLSIDTQIILGLIPGLKSGSSLEIAKGVLSAISGTYSSGGTHETSKFGHLLFICEELFGAPSITVRLFFGSKESHSKITSSPCHKTSSVAIEQKQEADTFLFVSPETIAKFASKYADQPKEYTELINRLANIL